MSEITLSTDARPLEHGHILGLRSHICEASVGDVKVSVSVTGAHLAVETAENVRPYKALLIDLAPLIQGAIEALPDVPGHSLFSERPDSAK